MGLNALIDEISGNDFRVLGFPCNNFGMQEPGANASEILNGIKYVRPGNGFVPNFKLFQKIDVNGKDEHALYTYLKSKCGPTSDQFEDSLFYDPKRVSDVRWNFEIFLINRSGIPMYRYSPEHDVLSIKPEVQGLLAESVQSPAARKHVDHNSINNKLPTSN